MSPNDRLKNKASNFQSKSSKRPYENTANYENSMKTNRIDPRVFSVYKILESARAPDIDYVIYVQDGYVEDNYIISYDKFNPPGNPL